MDLSPEPIYNIALSFANTKTLLAANRLNVFLTLDLSPKTAAQVAEKLGYHERSTEMLLNACVSLGLCAKERGVFSNTAVVDEFLIPGKPAYLGNFLNHFNDHMYPTWFYLEEAVRTGHAQIQRVVGESGDHFFQAIDRTSQDLETFMLTMEEHSLLEGKALARAYDFSAHRELLDMAGGTGAMSVSILREYPHLKATLFDRPPVCEIAKKCVASHGFAGRIELRPGDMFKEAFEPSADVVLLSAILHNWKPGQAVDILRQCHRALKPGGTLLISDQVLSDDKTTPREAVLCSLNMLLVMEGGQEYSRADFASFLTEAGFRLIEIRPLASVRQLLIAKPIDAL
jgi:ubiquinone/menaquinone biosynthesis C-methylase UbiE